MKDCTLCLPFKTIIHLHKKSVYMSSFISHLENLFTSEVLAWTELDDIVYFLLRYIPIYGFYPVENQALFLEEGYKTPCTL